MPGFRRAVCCHTYSTVLLVSKIVIVYVQTLLHAGLHQVMRMLHGLSRAAAMPSLLLGSCLRCHPSAATHLARASSLGSCSSSRRRLMPTAAAGAMAAKPAAQVPLQLPAALALQAVALQAAGVCSGRAALAQRAC